MSASTLDKQSLLNDLKDPEVRRLFYYEHILTGLPIQTRELRKKRGLTQTQLARLTGKDQATISKLENPNYEYQPQIGTLKALADAFDVPLIIRFGTWEEIWDWETNLSPRRIAPGTFVDALPRLERRAKPLNESPSSTIQMQFTFGDSTNAASDEVQKDLTGKVLEFYTRKPATVWVSRGDSVKVA